MKTLHGKVDGQFSPLERTHLADGGSQMFQTPEVDVFVVFAKAISSIKLAALFKFVIIFLEQNCAACTEDLCPINNPVSCLNKPSCVINVVKSLYLELDCN